MKFAVQFAAALIVAAASYPSFGIGRSGNGSNLVSTELGFESEAPSNFQETARLEQAALRLSYPGFEIKDGFMLRPFIEVAPLEKRFADLKSVATRAEVSNFFTTRAWTKMTAVDPCLDVFQQPDAQVFVMMWGPGKGISVLGPQSLNVQNGIAQIVRSLTLKEGACAW